MSADSLYISDRIPPTTHAGYKVKKMDSRPCNLPWFGAWINAVGNVTCCPQNSTVFGNLNRVDSFEDVWNSDSAHAVRRDVARGDYVAAGCDKECPFLRGHAETPKDYPPHSELIAPEIDCPQEEDSLYGQNYFAARKNYESSGTRIDNLPLFVDIQPLLLCNSDCFMCGQPHGDKTRHSTDLSEKIKALAATANYFRWQGGEVFLIKSFADFVDSHKRGNNKYFRTYVISNGSKISQEDIDLLTCADEPTIFLMSMDGASEATHFHVRRRKYFGKAIKAIERLALRQRELGRRDLVRWNFVVMKTNFNEIEDVISMAERLGLDVNLAPLQGNYPEENFFLYPDLLDDDYCKDTLNRLEAYASRLPISVTGFAGMRVRLENRDKMLREVGHALVHDVATSAMLPNSELG